MSATQALGTANSCNTTAWIAWEARPSMTFRLQGLIVDALEWACGLLHRVPGYHCKLARWSSRLDERWGTGRWQPPREDDA